MATKKMTSQINRDLCRTLRGQLTKALDVVLEDHNLKGALGNMTFEPGREIRFKVTIIQPANPSATTQPKPAVGDRWSYGNKTYRITQVNLNDVIGERSCRPTHRNFYRTSKAFRIKTDNLMQGGIKLS